jgi:hypothetical protein
MNSDDVVITLTYEESVQLTNSLAKHVTQLSEGGPRYHLVASIMEKTSFARTDMAKRRLEPTSTPDAHRYKVSDGVHGKSGFASAEEAKEWFMHSDLERATVTRIRSVKTPTGTMEVENPVSRLSRPSRTLA